MNMSRSSKHGKRKSLKELKHDIMQSKRDKYFEQMADVIGAPTARVKEGLKRRSTGYIEDVLFDMQAIFGEYGDVEEEEKGEEEGEDG
jgi:hypothetical protein